MATTDTADTMADVAPPRPPDTQSDSYLACYLDQREVIRVHSPDVPMTTNFMGWFKALDYWRVIEMHDTVGLAIQNDDPNVVSDVKCKATVLTYIAALLDCDPKTIRRGQSDLERLQTQPLEDIAPSERVRKKGVDGNG